MYEVRIRQLEIEQFGRLKQLSIAGLRPGLNIVRFPAALELPILPEFCAAILFGDRECEGELLVQPRQAVPGSPPIRLRQQATAAFAHDQADMLRALYFDLRAHPDPVRQLSRLVELGIDVEQLGLAQPRPDGTPPASTLAPTTGDRTPPALANAAIGESARSKQAERARRLVQQLPGCLLQRDEIERVLTQRSRVAESIRTLTDKLRKVGLKKNRVHTERAERLGSLERQLDALRRKAVPFESALSLAEPWERCRQLRQELTGLDRDPGLIQRCLGEFDQLEQEIQRVSTELRSGKEKAARLQQVASRPAVSAFDLRLEQLLNQRDAIKEAEDQLAALDQQSSVVPSAPTPAGESNNHSYLADQQNHVARVALAATATRLHDLTEQQQRHADELSRRAQDQFTPDRVVSFPGANVEPLFHAGPPCRDTTDESLEARLVELHAEAELLRGRLRDLQKQRVLPIHLVYLLAVLFGGGTACVVMAFSNGGPGFRWFMALIGCAGIAAAAAIKGALESSAERQLLVCLRRLTGIEAEMEAAEWYADAAPKASPATATTLSAGPGTVSDATLFPTATLAPAAAGSHHYGMSSSWMQRNSIVAGIESELQQLRAELRMALRQFGWDESLSPPEVLKRLASSPDRQTRSNQLAGRPNLHRTSGRAASEVTDMIAGDPELAARRDNFRLRIKNWQKSAIKLLRRVKGRQKLPAAKSLDELLQSLEQIHHDRRLNAHRRDEQQRELNRLQRRIGQQEQSLQSLAEQRQRVLDRGEAASGDELRGWIERSLQAEPLRRELQRIERDVAAAIEADANPAEVRTLLQELNAAEINERHQALQAEIRNVRSRHDAILHEAIEPLQYDPAEIHELGDLRLQLEQLDERLRRLTSDAAVAETARRAAEGVSRAAELPAAGALESPALERSTTPALASRFLQLLTEGTWDEPCWKPNSGWTVRSVLEHVTTPLESASPQLAELVLLAVRLAVLHQQLQTSSEVYPFWLQASSHVTEVAWQCHVLQLLQRAGQQGVQIFFVTDPRRWDAAIERLQLPSISIVRELGFDDIPSLNGQAPPPPSSADVALERPIEYAVAPPTAPTSTPPSAPPTAPTAPTSAPSREPWRELSWGLAANRGSWRPEPRGRSPKSAAASRLETRPPGRGHVEATPPTRVQPADSAGPDQDEDQPDWWPD